MSPFSAIFTPKNAKNGFWGSVLQGLLFSSKWCILMKTGTPLQPMVCIMYGCNMYRSWSYVRFCSKMGSHFWSKMWHVSIDMFACYVCMYVIYGAQPLYMLCTCLCVSHFWSFLSFFVIDKNRSHFCKNVNHIFDRKMMKWMMMIMDACIDVRIDPYRSMTMSMVHTPHLRGLYVYDTYAFWSILLVFDRFWSILIDFWSFLCILLFLMKSIKKWSKMIKNAKCR